jgi:hypothetical protein
MISRFFQRLCGLTSFRPSRILDGIFVVAFAVILVLMVANSFLAKNWDFSVFYRTGRLLLDDGPVYSLVRDQAGGFKYPPWVAPFFVPFALLPESAANAVWRLLQVFSLIHVIRWCARATGSAMAPLIATVLSYGVLTFNILSGQVQLVLLALSLQGFERMKRGAVPGLVILISVLSVKIFNLFSLLGVPFRFFGVRAVLWTGFLFAVLSLPVISGFDGDVLQMIRMFRETAGARTGNLAGAREGLSSLFLFLSRSDPEDEVSRWSAFLAALVTGGGYLWWLRSRIRDERVFFAVALAFGAAIHPLAFAYSFAWALPMTAFAVHRMRSCASGLRDRILFGTATYLLFFYGSAPVFRFGTDAFVFGPRAVGCLLLALVLAERGKWRSGR